MNQKGFVNIIWVLIIVVLAGGIGYFAFVKKSGQITQQPTPTPAITQTKTPAPTPKDETANWKTYINSQYGFELKYPATGTMKEGIGYAGATPTSFTLSFNGSAGSQRFELQIPYKDTTSHLEDFACSSGTEGKTCFTKDMIINGSRIVVTTFVRNEGEGVGTKEKSAIAINNGKLFKFYTGSDPLLQKYTFMDLSKDKFLFDQILSTLKLTKLTQSETPVSPALAPTNTNAKFYQNATLGFQLTLPNKSWFTELGDDPHLYANETCSQQEWATCAALEVQNHDSEFAQGIDSTFNSLKAAGQKPVKLTSLIPGAIVIKSDAPGPARGWSWEYDIFFSSAKKRFLIFTNNVSLEQSVLPTFKLFD